MTNNQQNMFPPVSYLTTAQLADMAGVSINRVGDAIRRGDIPTLNSPRPGGKKFFARVSPLEAEKWLAKLRREARATHAARKSSRVKKSEKSERLLAEMKKQTALIEQLIEAVRGQSLALQQATAAAVREALE